MQPGEFLRHRARPEWGIGQVISKGEDRIDVQFRHTAIPLRLSVAAPFLERVSRAEAALAGADLPPPRKERAKTAKASKAT